MWVRAARTWSRSGSGRSTAVRSRRGGSPRGAGWGAVGAVVIDARDEFAEDFCLPALRANALYMDRYPLVSALSRPLIVRHLVATAARHGGTIVSHGCPGKGNDQVRFEVGIGALAPHLQVIAPARDY